MIVAGAAQVSAADYREPDREDVAYCRLPYDGVVCSDFYNCLFYAGKSMDCLSDLCGIHIFQLWVYLSGCIYMCFHADRILCAAAGNEAGVL